MFKLDLKFSYSHKVKWYRNWAIHYAMWIPDVWSFAFITCIEVLDKSLFSDFPYKLSYLSQFSKNVVETFRHMAETKLSGWQVVFLCEHRLYIHPVSTSIFIYPACVKTHCVKNITDRLLTAFEKKKLHENLNMWAVVWRSRYLNTAFDWFN